jgi:hypothetical protein
MKCAIVVACAVGVLNLLAPAQVHAQSLRCNGDLAGVGYTKASVMNKCGKPALTDWFCKPVAPIVQQSTIVGAAPNVYVPPCERVDDWTYFPGYGQFVTTFRFESGVVREMKYGDRIN